MGIQTAEHRFWAKVQKMETCWLWIGATYGGGYGSFKDNGKTCAAHRWSFERLVGSIPSGLTIDHTCRNRACVNPDHLEIVTNRENVLRGIGIAAQNARKTHCCNGHLLSGTNLRKVKEGRACRECHNQWLVRFRAKRIRDNRPSCGERKDW